MFVSHNLSVNPFCLCPSYERLAQLPLPERMKELRRPEVRAQLIKEVPNDPRAPLFLMGRRFDRMFPVGEPMDYEPLVENCIAAQAQRRGVKPEELAYDMLLENDGKAMLYVALANYAYGTLEPAYEMMLDKNTVIGLGDGGAHYGMISDASYPTFMLAHWTRDRVGQRLSLPWVVKALSHETAMTVGLADRGLLAPGYKADINVMDYNKLKVMRPRVINDLPAGGRRLMQDAEGFRATIVSGTPILRDGKATGAVPGRLVRGAKAAPN
jgi:N-acyl-D-aspartate/D-glutamate deacylase